MTHTTSDPFLFATESRHHEALRMGSEALLSALQYEHPEIVRHLQDRAATYRAAAAEDVA